MAHTYRPPDEGEVFNTFHDLVHAAILCAGNKKGTATLKEIYAACVNFGRVKCRKTGGWRLVTDRRNWKSHIRHTLYTTEKFLRCPHDPDSWMLSPDYSNALPQTTRHLLPCSVAEEDGSDLAAQAFHPTRRPTEHPRKISRTAGQQGRSSRHYSADAADRWRPSAADYQSYDDGYGGRYGDDRYGGYSEEEAVGEDEYEEDMGQQGADEDVDYDMADLGRGPLHGGGLGSRRGGAAAAGYGVGSSSRRAEALLGLTAAAEAAEAAGVEEELDVRDEETRTALLAAQEVLNNPAAARILLRLVQQRQAQQQLLALQAFHEQPQPQLLLMQQPVQRPPTTATDALALLRRPRCRPIEDRGQQQEVHGLGARSTGAGRFQLPGQFAAAEGLEGADEDYTGPKHSARGGVKLEADAADNPGAFLASNSSRAFPRTMHRPGTGPGHGPAAASRARAHSMDSMVLHGADLVSFLKSQQPQTTAAAAAAEAKAGAGADGTLATANEQSPTAGGLAEYAVRSEGGDEGGKGRDEKDGSLPEAHTAPAAEYLAQTVGGPRRLGQGLGLVATEAGARVHADPSLPPLGPRALHAPPSPQLLLAVQTALQLHLATGDGTAAAEAPAAAAAAAAAGDAAGRGPAGQEGGARAVLGKRRAMDENSSGSLDAELGGADGEQQQQGRRIHEQPEGQQTEEQQAQQLPKRASLHEMGDAGGIAAAQGLQAYSRQVHDHSPTAAAAAAAAAGASGSNNSSYLVY